MKFRPPRPLPARLLYSLRSRARRRRQREQWLDALVAATPDDAGLLSEEQATQREQRLRRTIRARTQPLGRVRRLWPVLRVAAVLVPLLVAAAVWWGQRPAPALHYTTGIGEQRELVLPDHSRVWLRPNSSLTWRAAGQGREVLLRGEAFFAVTKDPARPFVVRTAAVAVRVLGTSFLVKAYPQLPATTVLVRTGRVQVAGPQRELAVLHPHDKLVFNPARRQLTLTHHEYTANLTTNPMLTFEQASLPEILLTLENYYPVRFELRPDAPAVALSGSLDPALSADQITDVLNTLLSRHHLRISRRTATTYRVE
ncbi:FecR domain-containing protein [Hymenobacter sp. NST-14]|uniref:FecR family protein n=1 Tax=Hymenobacter piscis TaxID=2839984 RepID=UPI001C02BC51|nr:FecR domain-containing protein [Hymenobacter piscis]MBT9395415.1 FecR domain-containing protein [Hymenobacter piscis]